MEPSRTVMPSRPLVVGDGLDRFKMVDNDTKPAG